MERLEKRGRTDGGWKRYWHVPVLALIAAASFGFNFYAIGTLGNGNVYYAAAVKSMSQSFHNFFYVSFDPAGFVSVDKPPLGLWMQVLAVKLFGYHGWAMLLPQALAATLSVLLMYAMVARHFNRPAGLIAAAVCAATPAMVVAARNNTMDTQLIFVLLLASWCLLRAVENGRWRWLFAAAVCVGLGFNIKMLEAYMILPAAVLVYLIFSPQPLRRRMASGLIAAAVCAAVSFAWVLAVDLTPASRRPYVDSSTNNTVSELIVGHNGLERLYGQGMGGGNFVGGGRGGMPGGTPPSGQTPSSGTAAGGTSNTGNVFGAPGGDFQPSQTDGGQNRPAFGSGFSGGARRGTIGVSGNEIGSAGPLRLWQQSLYGQGSWLLILAIFCIAALVRRPERRPDMRAASLWYWTIWLLTMAVFFSFAGFWHRYYLCILAPGLAGLIGPGIVEMGRTFRARKDWRQWLLPAAVLATDAVAARYVWVDYPALRGWLFPLIAGAGAAALVLMAAWRLRPGRFLRGAAAALTLVSLLAGPVYWSLTVVIYPTTNFTTPYAGPELAQSSFGGNRSGSATSGTSSLESYLAAHYKKGSYLVVSQRADNVAQFIIDTGLPAIGYGGFLGSDNSLTLDRLKELVKDGKITYFLVSGESGRSDSELIRYVEEHAAKIDASEYGGSSGRSEGTLYLFP